MSNAALTWANSLPRVLPNGVRLTVGCRAVLKQLADYADSEWQCYPSQQRLSEDTFLSARAVRNCLDRLEAACLISRRARYWRNQRVDDPSQGVGGGRRGTLYTLLPAANEVTVTFATSTAQDVPDADLPDEYGISQGDDRLQQADEKLPAKSAGNFSDPFPTLPEPVDNFDPRSPAAPLRGGSYRHFSQKLPALSAEVTGTFCHPIKEEPSKEPSREPENNDPRVARDAAIAAGPADADDPEAESKSEADAFLERLSPELSMEQLDAELESRLGRQVSGVWWPDVARQVLAAASSRVMHPAAYVAGCVAREPYRWGVDLGPAPERPTSLTPTTGGTPVPSRYTAADDPDLSKHLVTVDELPAELRAQLHGHTPAAPARPAGAPDAPPGTLPHLSDTTIV
jgi:hypothetical protein